MIPLIVALVITTGLLGKAAATPENRAWEHAALAGVFVCALGLALLAIR